MLLCTVVGCVYVCPILITCLSLDSHTRPYESLFLNWLNFAAVCPLFKLTSF